MANFTTARQRSQSVSDRSSRSSRASRRLIHDEGMTKAIQLSQSGIPFSEWSDEKINRENWSDPGRPLIRMLINAYTNRESQPIINQPIRFDDLQIVHLPYSLVAYEWKSAENVFPGCNIVVYVDRDDQPDFIQGSLHLIHSEFIRSFISSINTLIYLGNKTKFKAEYTSPFFVPTTDEKPWRPWHHIYSGNNPAGKTEHVPQVNPIGKYIVRLFWLGTWRRIYVDDKIPLDFGGNILLPSLASPKSMWVMESPEDGVIELWPFLLSKALLKIASLSWIKDKEIVDFDIIQCLTGWVPQKIDTNELSSHEIWNIFWAYSKHFSGPFIGTKKETTNEDGLSAKKSYTSKSSSALSQNKKTEKIEKMEKKNEKEKEKKEKKEKKKKEKKAKKGKKGKKDKKTGEALKGGQDSSDEDKVNKDENTEDKSEVVAADVNNFAYYLMAKCNDLRNFDSEDAVPRLSPCWSHEFLIDQTRNIPLRKIGPDLPPWKKIRWTEWAIKHGIFNEEELHPQILSCKIVTAFKEIYQSDEYKQPSKISINLLSYPNRVEKKISNKGKKQPAVKDTKNKDEKKLPTKDKKFNDAKERKSNRIVFDPSFWVDYEKLSSHINSVTLYLKPSRFDTKIKISDINQSKYSHSFDNWKFFDQPLGLLISQNEPIYIFCESLDSKFFVLNLTQAGFAKTLFNVEQVEQDAVTSAPDETITECEFCLAALVKRIKVKVTMKNLKAYKQVIKLKPQLIEHDRTKSHIVLEEYNWQTNNLGEAVTSLNTYGTKSTSFYLNPGRKVLRLWIKSDTSYVLQILSDSPVVVGSLESILNSMSQESQLFEATCHEVSNEFLKLIDAFGTATFPQQLKVFYNSYKPQEQIRKCESTLIHDTFYSLLRDMITESLSKDEANALNVLLFRWQNLPRPEHTKCFDFCSCYDDADLEYVKLLERYIVQLQAFYRGTFARNQLKCHKPSHKDFTKVLDCLLNIYDSVFSIDNRNTVCAHLIRALVDHPELSKIKQKYSFYKDLENVVILKKVSQRVRIQEGQWTLLCRQNFFVKSAEPVPIKINLFCTDLNQYVIRVIDNDSGNEIKRYADNVAVEKYKTNSKGYTALSYIRSPTSRQVDCTLCFTSKKGMESDAVLVPKSNVELKSFYGMYVPNVNNTICKYIIRVKSEQAALSINFATCYSYAILCLKLFDERGRILKEVVGKGDIILPIICLEYRTKQGAMPLIDSTASISSSPSMRRVHRRKERRGPRASHAVIPGLDDLSLSHRQLGESHHGSKRSHSVGHHRDRKQSVFTESRQDLLQEAVQDNSDSESSESEIAGYEPAQPLSSVYASKIFTPSELALNSTTNVLPYQQKQMKPGQPAEYRLEVSVIDDSWPLTAEEWQNVQNPTMDGQYTLGRTSRHSLKSGFTFAPTKERKPQTPETLKLERSPNILKTTASSRNISMKQKSPPSNLVVIPKRLKGGLEKPYWVMQTVHNQLENIEIFKDTKREFEIKEAKAKWGERDPGRSKRANELRRTFLEKNLILNPAQNDFENCRSLVKETFATKILPPLDLTKYMKKDPATVKEDDRKVKTARILEEDKRREEALIEKAENYCMEMSEKMNKFIDDQIKYINIANSWFEAIRKESYQLMQDAVDLRTSAIKEIIAKKRSEREVEIKEKKSRAAERKEMRARGREKINEKGKKRTRT